jgi:hypothetical protein
MIRGPSGRHVSRDPILAVLRSTTPGSILIEVFISDNVGRDIAQGLAMVFTPVPGYCPVVKIIVAWRSIDVILRLLILAGDNCLFTRVDGECTHIASHLALPVTDRHVCFIGIRISIDSIFTRTLDREREVWSIDL